MSELRAIRFRTVFQFNLILAETVRDESDP